MHIVFATTQFATEKQFYGGLSNYVENISNILAQHGHLVSVAVLSDVNENINWKKNITVERVKIPNNLFIRIISRIPIFKKNEDILMKLNLIFQSMVLNRRIRKINNENKIDIIQYCNSGALDIKRLKDIPSIVRLSNFPSLWRHAYYKEFNFKKALRDLNAYEKFELLSVKKADAVIAPSRLIADVTQRYIKKKVTVLESPYYLNSEAWDYSIYDNLLKDKKYLLFYGSLGYLKGIHIIIEIVNELLAKYPDLYIVMVGHDFGVQSVGGRGTTSAYKEVIKAAGQNHERVIYIKEIKKPLLFPIIEQSYACILPSRVDNLPNTCIEAMSLGKIVIGTEGASFEQLIKDNYSGFLCRRDSTDAYRDAVTRLMQLSEEERLVMGNNARERTELMAPEVIYKKYLEFYQETIVKWDKTGRK